MPLNRGWHASAAVGRQVLLLMMLLSGDLCAWTPCLLLARRRVQGACKHTHEGCCCWSCTGSSAGGGASQGADCKHMDGVMLLLDLYALVLGEGVYVIVGGEHMQVCLAAACKSPDLVDLLWQGVAGGLQGLWQGGGTRRKGEGPHSVGAKISGRDQGALHLHGDGI